MPCGVEGVLVPETGAEVEATGGVAAWAVGGGAVKAAAAAGVEDLTVLV